MSSVVKWEGLKVSRGLGNHVSFEFNLLYRWHATVSATDESWTEGVFKQTFGDKQFDQSSLTRQSTPRNASLPESKVTQMEGSPKMTWPRSCTSPLRITPTPSSDAAPACAPTCEDDGYWAGQTVGSLHDERVHGFSSGSDAHFFEEWNPDPEIAVAAHRLYGHVDDLELYTGLQAESTMPLTDGSRFACGYTTIPAFLVMLSPFFIETVSIPVTPLVRLYFYRYDYLGNMKNGGKGGQIAPPYFAPSRPLNSVYSLVPFFTASRMQTIPIHQGHQVKYDFNGPGHSRTYPPPFASWLLYGYVYILTTLTTPPSRKAYQASRLASSRTLSTLRCHVAAGLFTEFDMFEMLATLCTSVNSSAKV
ncbi:hypothetical protein GALMADRAFT_212793 [Galerina marginata CBS 339.88]|uniref:Uncharacterized protein n=1 Tax=Galerina marginata (strain CBS 339.88) TaxID=685588 RepID=A0A067T0D9_GALM3|nr:hypothetical protein GALMADRAFT_212793 [Galerina marginata CBS 339.88]